MLFRFLGKILVFLLITLQLHCGQETKSTDDQAQLLDRIDTDSLYVQWEKWHKKVTDSGTLQKFNLNQPDTLFAVLNNKLAVKDYLHKMLSGKTLQSMMGWERRINSHGLSPDFYHYRFLGKCNQQITRNTWAAAERIPYDSISLFMILSADAALGMYHDLGNGRIMPTAFGSVYKLPGRKTFGLKNLLKGGNPFDAIASAEPSWGEYLALQQAWIRCQSLQDSQLLLVPVLSKTVKVGEKLSRSIRISVAAALRLRGYEAVPHDSFITKQDTFSAELSSAVKSFQLNEGLQVQGYLNQETTKQLGLSKSSILLALQGTMERWRWLGPIPESNRIWVNIAANRLHAFRNDSLLVSMKTCSGEPRGPRYYKRLAESHKPKSKVLPPDNLETPNFKAKTTHLVVNPTWFVPRNILTKEMLPEIKRNPEILKKMGYVVKDREGEEVDPFSIDWEKVSATNIPYTLEQTGGSDNSLGRVVVHFPNAYSIFMHDTPHKWAFGLDERHVSHGCVRLEKPFELVEYLLSFNKKNKLDQVLMTAGMTPKHSKELIKTWGKDKSLRDSLQKHIQKDKHFQLDSMLPVYLVYFTAYRGPQNKVSFAQDSYRRDIQVQKAMQLGYQRRIYPANAAALH